MSSNKVFPAGNPDVETTGTYGYAVLPDGFVQQPWNWDVPELMIGSYAPGTGQDFYFFPNNPERSVIVPGGVGLHPNGAYATEAYPRAPSFFRPSPRAVISSPLSAWRQAPESGVPTHQKLAGMPPMWLMPFEMVESLRRSAPRTLWEAVYGIPPFYE